MHKVIEVTIEQVYGREIIRPANDTAHAIAAIAGTKTLTRQTIERAKALDLEVRDVTPRATL